MTHVSVIVVDYNGRADTIACLASLAQIRQDTFTLSVVVVDNASKQPLVIPEGRCPSTTQVLRSDTNLGFTRGNMLGYRHAKEHFHPDYIFLLNNDTLVHADFLEEVLAVARTAERPALVAPKIYFAKKSEFHRASYAPKERGRVVWYAGGSIDWKNLDAFHRGVDEVDHGQFDGQTESDFATGCVVLIPVVVLDKIALFRPSYFMYLEDVDLSLRARFAGFPILFAPKAIVWHKNAGSSGGAGSPLHQYYQTRNRLAFFFLYGTWRIKLTVIRFAAKLFSSGTPMQRAGVLDWFTGRMGKKRV